MALCSNISWFHNKIEDVVFISIPRKDFLFFEMNFWRCFGVKHHHLFYYKLKVMRNLVSLINLSFVNCIFQVYWWIAWWKSFLFFWLFYTFSVLHLKSIFICLFLGPLKLFLYLSLYYIFVMLFLNIFNIFRWLYILCAFIDGGKHTSTIELILISLLSVTNSANIFKLSLKLWIYLPGESVWKVIRRLNAKSLHFLVIF